MQLKTSLLVAFCAGLLLPACSSSSPDNSGNSAQIAGLNGQVDLSVYQQRGMEISSVTARMADTLQQNMFYYLLPDAPIDRSSADGNVKIVTMPRLAITSFVDTDTYENAGYLGRALAEFFTHEMSSRAFEVTEYKLTGKLVVAKDGDFILSRNWKKIARDTKVKYLLGGTITRNHRGVVVVARIVNMQTRQTIATATDFIPYSLLPSCYQSTKANCTFAGADDYLSPEQIRNSNYYKSKYEEAQSRLKALKANTEGSAERMTAKNAMTKAQVVSSSGRPLGGVFMAAGEPVSAPGSAYVASGTLPPDMTDAEREAIANSDPRFNNNIVVGATSRGNYDKARAKKDGTSIIDNCTFGKCPDPVVYPANTYMHNTLLVRDTADESNYERTSN